MLKVSSSIKSLDLNRPHEAASYTIFRFLKSVLELSEFISEVNQEDFSNTVSSAYYKGGPLKLNSAGCNSGLDAAIKESRESGLSMNNVGGG
jgi:hypothetical protein